MEANRNAGLLAIEVYCTHKEAAQLAEAAGYGIEEEGLPYVIIRKDIAGEEACEMAKRPGLGVVVLVSAGSAAVYTRQLKNCEPLFQISTQDKRTARVMGKNAARIVKNQPFADTEY